jgi:hypothetical protein
MEVWTESLIRAKQNLKAHTNRDFPYAAVVDYLYWCEGRNEMGVYPDAQQTCEWATIHHPRIMDPAPLDPIEEGPANLGGPRRWLPRPTQVEPTYCADCTTQHACHIYGCLRIASYMKVDFAEERPAEVVALPPLTPAQREELYKPLTIGDPLRAFARQTERVLLRAMVRDTEALRQVLDALIKQREGQPMNEERTREQEAVDTCIAKARELQGILASAKMVVGRQEPSGRYVALANTALEEAIHWLRDAEEGLKS